MKRLLLTTTVLTFAAVAAHAQTVAMPGHGTIADASGNSYQITADGSILENGDIWVAGGGGTAELTIENGSIYGLDATGKGWFALSPNGQLWTSSQAPPDVTSASLTTPTTTSTVAVTSAAPAATTGCPAIADGAASAGFSTANGQFYTPGGTPFVARGIDVYDSAMGSASQILAMFPGINFIRLNVYSYGSPSAYQAFVNTVTAAGVVVMVDWHVGAGGGVEAPTGSALTAETNWFASMAAAYKSNPAVWFNSLNEPANDQNTISEQTAVYQAIRGAGSNAIVLLEWAGQTGSYASGMTNVGVDAHYYGWQSGYSTDQGTVNANLQSYLATVQQAFGNVPVLIGEYGISTDGNSPDPNGDQVVSAVDSSGLGSAAWNWDSQAGSDNLTTGGSMTSYGQTVAGYFALTKDAAPAIWAACPTTTATVSTQ